MSLPFPHQRVLISSIDVRQIVRCSCRCISNLHSRSQYPRHPKCPWRFKNLAFDQLHAREKLNQEKKARSEKKVEG